MVLTWEEQQPRLLTAFVLMISWGPVQLAKMREGDPSAKALIFTQFNATLEWLMARLTQEGYGYRTISGSMPLKKRSQVCFVLLNVLCCFGIRVDVGFRE